MWVWQQTTVVNTASASLERTAKFSTQNVVRQRGRPRFSARFANIWEKPEAQKETSIIMIQVLAVPASTSPLQVLLKMATLNMGSIQISWQYSWDLFTSLMISLAMLTKRNAKFQWNAKKNTNKMLSESLIKKIDMVGPFKLVLYRVSQKKSFLRLAPFPI